MLTAIVGANWGDEGKGRMVDLLAENFDVVVRYQGGNNAGHTVVNAHGKFILNLLPSGILRHSTVNVLGNGMVIDLEHLANEISALTAQGVKITADNLKISDKAVICLPYHKQLDILEEDRLGDAKFGSTRRGIAPVYADKYMKKALRLGDLFSPNLAAKLESIVDWKNITLRGYNHPPAVTNELLNWLEQHGGKLKQYIGDTGSYLQEAITTGKNILFEAQLGALRDLELGIYPFTSSSSTLAAYAPIGAGIPQHRLEHVIAIVKAYSSCVGEGPFTAELSGDEAQKLREIGGEYGAATGRPRRVGAFDLVATAYGLKLQGADCVALTKLDTLAYLAQIPVCTAYLIDGQPTTQFPSGDALLQATPVFEYLPGFQADVSQCRQVQDLPSAALNYIRYLEQQLACRIDYVSVGPNRDDIIFMN